MPHSATYSSQDVPKQSHAVHADLKLAMWQSEFKLLVPLPPPPLVWDSGHETPCPVCSVLGMEARMQAVQALYQLSHTRSILSTS